MLKTIVLRAITWPLYFGALIALIIRVMWGTSSEWYQGVLVTHLSPTSWPMRSWYKAWGGTTFGYGIMLAPNQDQSVLEHEMVHVEQLEGAAIAGFFEGLLILAITRTWEGLIAFFVLWLFSGAIAYLSAMLTAWLRAEPNVYRGNAMEEAAYNATRTRCKVIPTTPPNP